MRKLNAKIRKGATVNYRYINEEQAFKLANRLIKIGSGIPTNRKNKIFTRKEFKKQLAEFKANLGTNAFGTTLFRRFISLTVRIRTDEQARNAYANLERNAKRVISNLNKLNGDDAQLDEQDQKMLNVLIDGALIAKKDDKYQLVNMPTLNDFYTVSDRYLQIKQAAIRYFGDEEYGEAFGS